jgi:hypothetical protein
MNARLVSAVSLALVLGLMGCQTTPVYAPRESAHGVGYADKQLSANRYRVSYRGDSATNRETVEDFLLRRAAEVTLKAGYTWFVFDTRDTKERTRYYTDFVGWPGWAGRGWYWHDWDFDRTVTTYSQTRYTAYAEIVVLTDDQAKGEARALKAQDVLDRLGPLPAPQ